MNTQRTRETLPLVIELFSDITFRESSDFFWSPKERTVFYNPSRLDSDEGVWALLHEIGHARLNHINYNNDFSLIKCELEAWVEASEIAKQLSYSIPIEHIDDCLNTYRDWIYARSSCPRCSLSGLQLSSGSYKCLNCAVVWNVSSSRFCRPYRMRSRHKKTPDANKTEPVFS